MNACRLTIDFKEIAARLAHLPNGEQADFFSSFLNELHKVCETHYRTEHQLGYIAKELSIGDRELLSMLSPEEQL